jgi:hypothetical protein
VDLRPLVSGPIIRFQSRPLARLTTLGYPGLCRIAGVLVGVFGYRESHLRNFKVTPKIRPGTADRAIDGYGWPILHNPCSGEPVPPLPDSRRRSRLGLAGRYPPDVRKRSGGAGALRISKHGIDAAISTTGTNPSRCVVHWSRTTQSDSKPDRHIPVPFRTRQLSFKTPPDGKGSGFTPDTLITLVNKIFDGEFDIVLMSA